MMGGTSFQLPSTSFQKCERSRHFFPEGVKEVRKKSERSFSFNIKGIFSFNLLLHIYIYNRDKGKSKYLINKGVGKGPISPRGANAFFVKEVYGGGKGRGGNLWGSRCVRFHMSAPPPVAHPLPDQVSGLRGLPARSGRALSGNASPLTFGVFVPAAAVPSQDMHLVRVALTTLFECYISLICKGIDPAGLRLKHSLITTFITIVGERDLSRWRPAPGAGTRANRRTLYASEPSPVFSIGSRIFRFRPSSPTIPIPEVS